ncbi:MAG TPA: NADH-quinone oxidoreductase subunit D [Gemmataceae bacterium]|nr:NADH-quinone oxidoreductase subunit D [Gemmataceae bacterium]
MATAAPPEQTDDQRIVEFDVRTDEMLVNMGPQHPSTHGVLRLVLRTDGEVISQVTPHLGYLHRCAEKIGENVTPIQFIPYTDRMDYLAGMNMNLAYSLAVEKLCGMKIPEKAQVIRVLIAEMNRIASHLVGMGAYGLDLGTFSPFLYAFREREMILDLFEEVCGARLTYSYLTVGGAHDDLPEGWPQRCREFLNYLKPRIPEYHTLLTTNHIFVQRTANIGNLDRDTALSYGCTGPMLRGSLDRRKGDPDWDLRRIEPYCGYETYDFNVVTPPFGDRWGWKTPPGTVIGDAWHRFMVRMLEVVESIKICEQALDRYATAQGSHRVELPRHLPAGEAYMETECPRGQMGFYVVGGPGKSMVPLRVRARSSSFCNLSVTDEICRNCLIADVPAVVGSIDIVMGEIDR